MESEGELVVRSKAMFAGYLNNEEATRAKLKDGWLHTGDIVSVDRDGLFHIVGRKEDFIKVNGFKVYATEVEKAIIGLDWVKECAVLAEKDAVGSEPIVAHIVPADSAGAPEVHGSAAHQAAAQRPLGVQAAEALRRVARSSQEPLGKDPEVEDCRAAVNHDTCRTVNPMMLSSRTYQPLTLVGPRRDDRSIAHFWTSPSKRFGR